jgi:hypothetical protein
MQGRAATPMRTRHDRREDAEVNSSDEECQRRLLASDHLLPHLSDRQWIMALGDGCGHQYAVMLKKQCRSGMVEDRPFQAKTTGRFPVKIKEGNMYLS